VRVHYKFLNIGVQIQTYVKLRDVKYIFSFNENTYLKKKKKKNPTDTLCLKDQKLLIIIIKYHVSLKYMRSTCFLIIPVLMHSFSISDVARLLDSWFKYSKCELACTMEKTIRSKRPGVSRQGHFDA
jgi:hypothetical protein